jgi:hypothetical protein
MLLASIVLACMLGDGLPGNVEQQKPPVEIAIQAVMRDEIGSAIFHITISNRGRAPIYLEADQPHGHVPFAVLIQIWVGVEGWLVVGPQKDAGPMDVFELLPGREIETQIPVLDPFPLRVNPKVGMRLTPITGECRAVLFYFKSKRAACWFRNKFKREYEDKFVERKGDLEVVSATVHVAPKEK